MLLVHSINGVPEDYSLSSSLWFARSFFFLSLSFEFHTLLTCVFCQLINYAHEEEKDDHFEKRSRDDDEL